MLVRSMNGVNRASLLLRNVKYISAAVELLRMLRAKGYGYKRIAGEYTRVTGEYISHTTVRERLVGG